MAYLLVRHKVRDYTHWKEVFDEALPLRKASGEKTFRVFCDADDPNDLTLLFAWDSLEMARQFAQSTGLKLGMQRTGVIEEPEITFLVEVASGRS